MAVVDIGILVVIALSCMMGGFRGLVKEALSLASWVSAIAVAALFYGALSLQMSELISNSSLRDVAAFALLFVLTIFVGTLISNLFSRLVSRMGLAGTDRLLGAVFGIIRGLIIVGLLVLLSYPLEFTREWFSGSVLVPHIVTLIEQVQLWFGEPSATSI